jgi:hypothetical protein
MRRIAVLIALAALGGVVAALAWRWWTAPPCAPAETLAVAATVVPLQADGLVVIAEPHRALRWLLRRPQSLALLALAAPKADAALPRMRSLIAALARGARGPLTVWWRGRDVAAGATVGTDDARALGDLAAIEGVPLRTTPGGADDVTIATASAVTVLDGGGGSGPQRGAFPDLAAIARCGVRWWQAKAGRNRLDLVSGVPPELLPANEASVVTTGDLAVLVALLGSGNGLPHVPARLAVAGDDWALALPATMPSAQLQRLLNLGGDTAAADGTRHWRGVLGDLWVALPPGFAVASRPELLTAVAGGSPVGETGTVRGSDLAAVCVRVGNAIEGIPGLGQRAVALRRAAPLIASLRLARWRITPAGGRILLEW